MWAFGANAHGQLGDGTTTPHTTPVQVVGLTGIVAIAAGGDHSLALQSDGGQGGVVWAWGDNADGAVGDGATVDRWLPVQVAGLGRAIAIGAGQTGSAAILADGTVAAWGANADGQIGNGTRIAALTPEPVALLTGVRALALGWTHTAAVDAAGRAWGWGRDREEQLGYPVVFNDIVLTLPRPLPGFGTPIMVAGGWQHTMVAMPDGAVAGVGTNGNGQLGNGTTGPSSATLVTIPGFTLADNAWLAADADGDHLSTWREYLAGTDPLSADSNGNGLPDDLELASALAATDPDTDGDGLPNVVEFARGTDPLVADTDGDGVTDLTDAFPLDPTRAAALPVDPTDHTPPTITLTEPTNAQPVP